MSEEIPEYVEDCFENFIDSPNEKVSIKKIPAVFSNLQRPFSKNYINELLKEENLENEEALDIDQFMKIFRVRKEDQAAVQMLVDSFMIFDSNQDGKIHINEFNNIVSSFGLPFTSEEYMKIIDLIEVENFEFDYKFLSELIISMISVTPEENQEEEEIADNIIEIEVEKEVEYEEEEEGHEKAENAEEIDEQQNTEISDVNNTDIDQKEEEEEFVEEENQEEPVKVTIKPEFKPKIVSYVGGQESSDVEEDDAHTDGEEEENIEDKRFVGSSDLQADSQNEPNRPQGTLASESLIDSNQLLTDGEEEIFDEDTLNSADIVLKKK